MTLSNTLTLIGAQPIVSTGSHHLIMCFQETSILPFFITYLVYWKLYVIALSDVSLSQLELLFVHLWNIDLILLSLNIHIMCNHVLQGIEIS